MEKKIITKHANPLLANFEALNTQIKPEKYSGFIYLWKCMPEDCYYLGSHKGKDNDEYRGSGKMFRRVFEHYGMTHFNRIILEYVSDESNIKIREQHWINQFKAVMSTKFYNQKHAVADLAN